MPIPDRSLIEAALEGLEAQKQRIADQIAELRALLGKRGPGRPPAAAKAAEAPEAPAPRKRRRMSAAARKRIGDAARKRWAAWKKQKAARS